MEIKQKNNFLTIKSIFIFFIFYVTFPRASATKWQHIALVNIYLEKNIKSACVLSIKTLYA